MTSPTRDTPFSVVRGGLGLIAQFVRRRPASFALAVTGAAAFASAIVASAVVVGWVTDRLIIPVLDGGEPVAGRLLPAVLLILGVATWKAAGITLRRTAAGWLQFHTQADLRSRLMEHQLDLRLSWFSRRTTGDLLAVTESDASQATWVLAPLPYGTGVSLLLVGSVVVITVIDPWLGLITLAALAGIVSADVWGAWRTFRLYEEVQELRGRMSGVAHESFDGALTVKALGREAFETARFRKTVEALRDGLIRVGIVFSSYRAVVDALPAATTVVLLLVGVVRIRAGAVTPGDMVTVAYLLSLLAVPVRLVGYVTWEMATSLAGWGRVEEVLGATEQVPYGTLPARRDGQGAEVSGRRVGFSYQEGPLVLDELHLEVPPGRTVAVVGSTGSGKSTLAVLLARLWDPVSGTISLDGRDLRRFARSELAAEVAYVPQEAFLFNDTVSGNISLGAPCSPEEVEQAARLAGAHEFVTALPEGYDTRIGERGTTLSGGQQQRVALARALVRRPRLLVLDDATSAVDPSVEARILRGLKEARLPSTVLVVAYRRATIVLADEVIYLEDGRVVAQGRHRDLLEQVPGYAHLLRAYEEDAAARQAEQAEEVAR
ncbi:MAG: ABC transporter ATP-binding protein/permease [Actinomycetota bacterium]|nr:ABC transporter ATP-binding protein/permease [Actinomycetota bacterium]